MSALLASLILIGQATPIGHETPEREWSVTCDRSLPPFSYQGAPLETLVADASSIVFARAVSFTPEARSDGLDGVYRFQRLWNLKGVSTQPLTVSALRPYEHIPQYYLDLTDRHQNFDTDSVYSFSQTIVAGQRDCQASARFVLGYNYLIFVDLDSFVSYEPVHSIEDDAWYISVDQATRMYEREY
jgi:hypothetical protein